MHYFIYLIKKATRAMIISTALSVVAWGVLYHLTNWETIVSYFWTGVAVCAGNTLVDNLRARKMKNVLHVQANWVIMAGVVLVLYHAGFTAAAVFGAAAILASPFFGATIYEAFVGFTLLVTLARAIA
jgi:phosphatidylserine synthase